MRKPWSISTTVRNPERLRDFLKALKQLEGEPFNESNQVKYQVLLIQQRLYKPLNIPSAFRSYYEDPTLPMPYDVAEQIFDAQGYEDPPMRGRQSVNPLNKLGFAICRAGFGPIRITELGNRFLAGDYDIGSVFFKSMLKLQFPNPWSTDFSEEMGFNIMPFVATLRLLYKLREKSHQAGLSKTEFSLFVPTLIDASRIDEFVEAIMKFRKEKAKDRYIRYWVEKFYETEEVSEQKVNNLFDYGDNIMRYFRLTRYFRVSTNSLGSHWTVDLEPSRMVEIEQLLRMYSGQAIKFANVEAYLSYLSDIAKPELPWEETESLRQVALSLKDIAGDLVAKEKMEIGIDERKLLSTDVLKLERKGLESYVLEIRQLRLRLKERAEKAHLVGNVTRTGELVETLRENRELKKFQPEQFEKLATEALRILNDEILIKPNYPIDDDGEPISHAPGHKPDLECYYQIFKGICEVTLNTSRLQWVHEGQPVMRHLRDFETQNEDSEAFCIFIAPRIHNDTYSQFWFSVKYEYDGSPQKIVPMTAEQFAVLLETSAALIGRGRKFSHVDLYDLYSQIVNQTARLNSFSEWVAWIQKVVSEWQKRLIS